MSELLLGLAQFRPKTANAEADEDRLDLVHDPRLLAHEAVPLPVWPFGILLFSRWDRDHAAVTLLAAQPAEQDAQQQFRIQAICFCASMFSRHRNARGMNDVSLNIVRPEPAGEPKAIASGFIGDNDALDRMSGLLGLVAPTMQEL